MPVRAGSRGPRRQHAVRRERARHPGERVDRVRERARIGHERGDVLEEDPAFGEVGNVANQRSQRRVLVDSCVVAGRLSPTDRLVAGGPLTASSESRRDCRAGVFVQP